MGHFSVAITIDRLDFMHPVFIGDFVTLMASVNFVGKTSMEIGVRVESENLTTGERRHTSTAYLTYVALNSQGRPIALPSLIIENEEQRQRNLAAQVRRENRLEEKRKEKERR